MATEKKEGGGTQVRCGKGEAITPDVSGCYECVSVVFDVYG